MVNITDKVSDNEDSISTNIPSSLGTASQVLAVNSGATATEWVDAAGGSTTKISTTEITSTVSNVGITLPTSGYVYCYAILEGIKCSSDGVYVHFNLSDDGGSTFESIYYNIETLGDADLINLGTNMRLNYARTLGNNTNEDLAAIIHFWIPSAGSVTNFTFVTSMNATNIYTSRQHGSGDISSIANQFDLSTSIGNLTAGKITLYGVA